MNFSDYLKAHCDTPCIVLAAGQSSRLGLPKGLYPFKGHTWLEFQLSQIPCSKIILVLGFNHAQYFNTLPFLQKSSANLQVVLNNNPERGFFSSIQTGLQTLDICENTFILPVDVPSPSIEVWQTIEAQCLNNKAQVGIPTYNNKKGHPVWLNVDFIKNISNISSENRLDEQIKKCSSQFFIQVVDPKICLNLNTQDDFNKFFSSNLSKKMITDF